MWIFISPADVLGILMFDCYVEGILVFMEFPSYGILWIFLFTVAYVDVGLIRILSSLALIPMHTVSTVRLKLSNLDIEMARLGHDIHKFNIMVKQQIGLLSSRGKTTTDLLENLFKGYLVVKEEQTPKS